MVAQRVSAGEHLKIKQSPFRGGTGISSNEKIILARYAPKAGAARRACGARKYLLRAFPGTPFPGCAAHLGNSVTGLFSIVLPDWSSSHFVVDLRLFFAVP
jgi:hypothetical protein